MLRYSTRGWLILLVFLGGQYTQFTHRHAIGKHADTDHCDHSDRNGCYHHQIPAEACLICNLILHHKLLSRGPEPSGFQLPVNATGAEPASFFYNAIDCSGDRLPVASRGPPFLSKVTEVWG